jgi:hypothetical protein
MSIARFFIDFFSTRQYRTFFSVMSLIRRYEFDPTMLVVFIIPFDKPLYPIRDQLTACNHKHITEGTPIPLARILGALDSMNVNVGLPLLEQNMH